MRRFGIMSVVSGALVASCLGIAWAPTASATGPIVSGGYTLETIAYEGFNYASGTLNDGVSGGTGWSTGWSTGDTTPFITGVTGLTYPGLVTDDSSIRASGTGGNNSESRRDLTTPADSGVVYFQFLSIFQSSHGGGTPNIRLQFGGTGTGGLGNNGAPNMAILSDQLVPLGTTTAPLTQQNFTVVRIDHDDSVTQMWINPDLSTFDYADPPTPDAEALGFAPKIDRIELVSRYGFNTSKDIFDEIHIMQLVAPAPPPPAPDPAGPATGVSAIAGDAQATVSWTAPADQGTYAMTFYRATAFPGNRSCLTTVAVPTCTVHGLVNDADYTFTVQALTGAGWGVRSQPSNVVTPRARTIEITSEAVTVRGDRGFRVRGVTTELPAGTELLAWVRLSRDRNFTPRPVRIVVDASGAFTWERRTGRVAAVYITTPDRSVESNRVVVAVR